MKVIKYIFTGILIFSFTMSLKPPKKKEVKIVKEHHLHIVPNYNNNGMNKADSG